MTNKLWVFGCSHGTRYFNLSSIELSWPEIVAHKLNLTLSNQCKIANSNDGIFNDIVDNCSKIASTDLVIVHFTHPERVIHNDITMLPSRTDQESWYKTVNSDDFYYNKFIQIVTASRFLLSNYYFGYTNPTLLVQQFANPVIKKLVTDRAMFYPKLTLHKSYPLGDDEKHLSAQGNELVAEYWIKYLERTMEPVSPV